MADAHSSGAACLAEPDLTGGLIVQMNVDRVRDYPAPSKSRLGIPVLDYRIGSGVENERIGEGCG